MQGTVQKKVLQKIMSRGSGYHWQKKNPLCIFSLLEIPNPSEAKELLSKTLKEQFQRVQILTKWHWFYWGLDDLVKILSINLILETSSKICRLLLTWLWSTNLPGTSTAVPPRWWQCIAGSLWCLSSGGGWALCWQALDLLLSAPPKPKD